MKMNEMIEMDKIHNVLVTLKQESFEFLYREIKDKYWDIFKIEDFLHYFKSKMEWASEYSLYADFLNYYFKKEDEQQKSY